MGHAGAIISEAGEGAAEKVEMLLDLGVTIAPNPSSMGPLVILVGGTSNIVPFRRPFFFLIQLVVVLI
jgi:succinyl-CoA synthetase alpha subunit